MSVGIGGDAFALVWHDGELTGLNASGRAPASADPDALGDEMPFTGPQSVTVPGAVAGWQALLERHGTWSLGRCLADAIDAAANGFEVTPVIAGVWSRLAPELAAFDEAARVFLPAPAVGTRWRNPDLAATLKRIAAEGPDGFYRGPVAAAIAAATWLEESDLAAMRGRLGRAAAARLRRRHRVRAAAQRPGRRGAAGDGPRARVRPRLAAATPIACTCRPRR